MRFTVFLSNQHFLNYDTFIFASYSKNASCRVPKSPKIDLPTHRDCYRLIYYFFNRFLFALDSISLCSWDASGSLLGSKNERLSWSDCNSVPSCYKSCLGKVPPGGARSRRTPLKHPLKPPLNPPLKPPLKHPLKTLSKPSQPPSRFLLQPLSVLAGAPFSSCYNPFRFML